MLNTIHEMFKDYEDNFFDYQPWETFIIIDDVITINIIDRELVEFWRNWFMITYNIFNKAKPIIIIIIHKIIYLTRPFLCSYMYLLSNP